MNNKILKIKLEILMALKKVLNSKIENTNKQLSKYQPQPDFLTYRGFEEITKTEKAA
jgi:hypothetical protein